MGEIVPMNTEQLSESKLTVEDGIVKDQSQVDSNKVAESLKPAQRASNGANWFFWIAGLSLANSLLLYSDMGLNFPIGLGITQVIDAFAMIDGGAPAMGVGLFFGVVVASAFAFFGLMGRKGYAWAFIAGLVLYTGDSLIFVLVQDWLSVGFHILGGAGIYGGLKATNQIIAARQTNPLVR